MSIRRAITSAVEHLLVAQQQLEEDSHCAVDEHLRTAIVILQQFADCSEFSEGQKAQVKEAIRLMLGSTS